MGLRRLYAIKVISKSLLSDPQHIRQTNTERALHLSASHINASSYDASFEGRSPFIVFLHGTWQDSAHLYLVMDYIQGGDLYTALRAKARFPVSVARFYAAEIVLALGFLHRMDIIFRDLKPENILITPSGHVKLTDFGFAKYVADATFTLCGTCVYLAPELIKLEPYTKSVDWYTLGIIVYEMLVGHPPFEQGNILALYQLIDAHRVTFPREYMGDQEIDFLRRTMTPDISSRYGHNVPALDPCTGQPILGMSSLVGDDSLPDGTEEVMRDPFFEGVCWPILEGSAGGYFGPRGGVRVPWIPEREMNFQEYDEIDFGRYNQAAYPLGHRSGLFPDF
ncbi:kinase-like protein [Dacryopinax primogenitus]|uniref:cAMP-dependent protein kinase n=1 Tax=Dacryopinax primogenitus (strain DJM 731) TaxID=1858805 RepID=M5FUI4_DACPD|nr:kinase-like protein [Dacryopinax primogenitus]EJT96906.1 kinase-like protein [Dacryopinax primogenitus]